MENIKKFINGVVEGKVSFKNTDLKKAICADFMKSGIMLFDNDSIAPFVQEGALVDVLTDRIYEGEHGQVAYDRVDKAVSYYDKAKKKDSKLSYSFGYGFEEVGSVDKTFSFFEKALKACGELSKDNVFGVRAKDKTTEKSFTAHETLVVENMARFEEMFEAKYGTKHPYEDAVTSVATILTLRAIAQKGEEDRVDNLAEQLYPFIVRSIKLSVAKKDYLGDRRFYDIAVDLAEERIEKLNNALGKQAIAVDFSALKRDERILSEISKVNNKFKDYHINIYGVGTNPAIGYVNANGEIVNLDKVSVSVYDVIEDMNDKIIGSVIDTHEEVFVSMLAGLIYAENSTKFNTGAKEQLTMALALPLVQAANALDEEKVNALVKETIAKLSKAQDIEIDKSVFTKKTKTTKNDEAGIVEENGDAPIVEETLKEPKPKKAPKPLTANDIRKKFIKKFVSENNKYYKKIGEGKVKASEIVMAHENVTQIAGLMSLEGKRLVMQPAEYVEAQKFSDKLPTAVVTEFANQYLAIRAEEIASRVGESEEEIEATKKEIEETKKEIGRFYTSRVKKGQISIDQFARGEANRDDK